MNTVADAIARTLLDAGIDVVFGLPGGEVVGVLDGLRRHGIRFVLVHNESAAVFMADGWSRVTGKPGVALTTLGPGATNAVAGAAHAYLDRAPILIITAQIPERLHSHHTHQLVDLHALYGPISKGTFNIQAGGAAETVRDSLRLAQQGRPGPVHLQIDKETADLDATAGPSPIPPEATPPPVRYIADRVVVARDRLLRAKRPVILAGLGLEPERPYEALRALAEAANAPVITTPKGKGALPDDHPLSAGTIGLTRADPVYEVLDEADCIVAVGLDVVELVKPWDQTAPLLWLAPWQNEDPAIAAEVELVGQMAPALQQLADSDFVPDPAWGAARVRAFKDKVAQGTLPAPAPNRLLPQTVFEAARAALPAEAAAAVDVGSHKIFGSLTWPTLRPNGFFVSNGLSCMGFALPATIGASLARPDQPVVCFTGDAGLSMVVGELGVLAGLDLPVIVVVLNDAAIDLIRSHQVRSGYPVFGTEFTPPNFAQIGAAYGIASYRVATEAELSETIRQAVASGRPALIEAMIDPISYPTTPE